MVVLLVMIQEFYCTNTHEYTNIPSCRGKLVFNSSRLQEEIFVYTPYTTYQRLMLVYIILTYQLWVLKRRYFCVATTYVLVDKYEEK